MEDTQSTARQSRYDDEIDLIDLWLVLMRRKWTVVTVFVLTVLIAGVFATLTPTRFQASTIIEIGGGPGTRLEDPRRLIVRLVNTIPMSDEARITDAEVLGGKRDGVENIIVVRAKGASSAGVQKFLASVVSDIEADHTAEYAELLELQQDLIDQIEAEISSVTADIERLGQHIEVLILSEPAQAAVLEIERARMRDRLTTLLEKRARSEAALDSFTKTQVLKSPALTNENPVKSRLKKHLVVGIVLGLAFGLFAAFVVEFFGKARARSREAEG